MTDLFLGIDLGTSGIRCAVIDDAGTPVAMTRGSYPDASAMGWWQAVTEGLDALASEIGPDAMARITRAAIDGTSGSMVLIDGALTPVTDPLMYNSAGFTAEAAHIADHAPEGHITRGPSSALARLLRLQSLDKSNSARHLCHQADFILAQLTRQPGHSDENNALKTGYDVARRQWPAWIADTNVNTALLPQVHIVGRAVAPMDPEIAARYGFSPALQLHAGSTDSIAAFLACGVTKVGEAVTSLGTTLAIKLLSDTRIDDPARGIYSHRLGDTWLVGGASNTGGGALLVHFTAEEMTALSDQIDPATDSGLDYYPLPKTGERFPVNDPDLPSRTSPRPASDAAFLHGLLEGIARIEALSYAEMHSLGAPRPSHVHTAGGGAANTIWSQLRARILATPVTAAQTPEAAIGMARLCRNAAS